MEKIELWQLTPNIHLHIHHKNLANFVKPRTCVPEWTIVAVEAGTYSYEWDDVKGHASDGDIIFCPPNKDLSRRVITPLSFHYMRVNWLYPDGTTANDHPDIPVGKVNVTNEKRLFSNLSLMDLLAKKLDVFNIHWMNRVMADIWNLYCADVCAVYMPLDIASEDPLMNHAVSLMNKQAHDKLNLKALAHSIGLSPVQFTRRFKAAFRMTPLDYLNSLRLNKVRKLLVETNLTLSKIANSCGFQNEYYLSKVFSDKYKISPSLFRKEYKL